MAMREKVYEKLSRAQVAVEAEDWEKAFKKLRDVEKMKDLESHEKAQLYTAYGYTYFAQERYRESADAYEKVLLQESLPEALMGSTRYTLAQLWFHLEDYPKVLEHLENWLTIAENPGPEPYILLGQAYYLAGRPRDAVEPVRQAIAVGRERGLPPQENWYALLRAFYHDLEDHPRLLEILELLVTRFPSKEYWMHLAATYGELDDTTRHLAAFEAAFAQGYLDGGSELLLLSQLLLQAEVPYRAAMILSKGIEDGSIEGRAQNWRLLSQAWILAQEHRRAIAALTKAAALSDDGELDARIAQSYANLDEWEETISAARVALRKGVRNFHEMNILIGMAMFELGRLEEAKSAFAAAQNTSAGRKAATQWLTYIEREEERLLEFETSLE
jgi:tetratricopeptide (TPR) repeat protein